MKLVMMMSVSRVQMTIMIQCPQYEVAIVMMSVFRVQATCMIQCSQYEVDNDDVCF